MRRFRGLTPDEIERYRTFSRDMVDALHDYVYKDFCQQLSLLTRKGPSRRKGGRPKSKVSSADFVRKQFLEMFDLYLQFSLTALKEGRHTIPKEPPAIPWMQGGFYSAFINSGASGDDEAIEDGPKDIEMFHLGAVFAAYVIRSIVLEIILRNPQEVFHLTDLVKMVDHDLRLVIPLLKKRGLSDKAIEIIVRNELAELPTDLRRKTLKPTFSQSKIARFTRIVTETEGVPYVKTVAKELKVNNADLMSLYREAKRQNKGISLQNGPKGEFFKID